MVERGTKNSGDRCRITLVLGAAFVIGCLLGTIFTECLTGTQTEEISSYLSDYIKLARYGSVSKSLGMVFLHHVFWMMLCVLIGFSFLGIICLPLFFVIRGFLIAFMIGCFIRFLGLGGLAVAVIISGISACVWLPGMIILSVGILKPVVWRLTAKAGDGQSVPVLGRECFRSLMYGFLLTLLCVYLEYLLIPALLPVVSRMISL